MAASARGAGPPAVPYAHSESPSPEGRPRRYSMLLLAFEARASGTGSFPLPRARLRRPRDGRTRPIRVGSSCETDVRVLRVDSPLHPPAGMWGPRACSHPTAAATASGVIPADDARPQQLDSELGTRRGPAFRASGLAGAFVDSEGPSLMDQGPANDS